MIDNFVIAGISGVVVIFYLVKIFKNLLKLEGDGVIALAAIIGIIIGLLNYATKVYPNFAPWYEQGIIGFMAAMAAVGIHKVQKQIINRF